MTRDVTFEELEFAGAMAVRFLEVDVTNYDAGGETFTPTNAGLSRIQHLNVEVIDGSEAFASYDEGNDQIVLYNSAGELGGGSSVTLRVQAIGRQ